MQKRTIRQRLGQAKRAYKRNRSNGVGVIKSAIRGVKASASDS